MKKQMNTNKIGNETTEFLRESFRWISLKQTNFANWLGWTKQIVAHNYLSNEDIWN